MVGGNVRAAITLVDSDFNYDEFMSRFRYVFASNLRRIIREKGIRSKDLASQLHVSQAIVTQWRNADRFPSPENMDRIAAHLQVPFAELFREPRSSPADVGALRDMESAFYALGKLLGRPVPPAQLPGEKPLLPPRDDDEGDGDT